jgi:hypothetical protein
LRSNLLLLIFCAVLYSCNNNRNGDATDQQLSDSAKIQDSVVKENVSQKPAEDEDSEELGNILSDYVQQYSKPYVFDSSYVFGEDTVKVLVKHFCLMDSAIIIPKKYVGMYKLDSLITHNFVTLLKVEKNGKEVVNRKIQKNDFEQYLDPYLKSYATLLYPHIKKLEDSIALDYSISIPLTDVGIGVRAIIKLDNNILFEKKQF